MRRGAFTMIELLLSLTIVAMIAAFALPFVGNYITSAQQTADQRTLLVLNDALTRYKTEGGDLTALTQGAPVSHILAKMGSTLTWNGYTHQVMQKGVTYPARSIDGFGSGRLYQFVHVNSYTSTNAGNSGSGGSAMAFGSGDPICFSVFAAMPAAAPTKAQGIFGMSDTGGNPFRPGAVEAYLDTSNNFVGRLYGTTTSDYVQISASLTSVAGTTAHLHWDVRAGALYVNGASVSVSGSSGGSAPAWSAAIAGSSYTIGYRPGGSFGGAMSKFQIWNFQLTGSDITALYSSGGVPAAQYVFGSQTPVYASNFSSGIDGWTHTGNSTQTGNVDGVAGEDDWLKEATTGQNGMDVFRSISYGSAKSFRIRARFYRSSAQYVATTHVMVSLNGFSSVFTAYTPGDPPIDLDIKLIGPVAQTSGNLYVLPSLATGTPLFTVNSNANLKNIIVTALGACVNTL